MSKIIQKNKIKLPPNIASARSSIKNTLGNASSELYSELFQEKLSQTYKELTCFNDSSYSHSKNKNDGKDISIEAFESPASGFRMRAEFKMWHETNSATSSVSYAMYEPGQYKKPIKIESFTIGHPIIQALMPKLLEKINQQDILKHKLFQAEFLTATTGESLITLIYHRQLDDTWLEQAKILAAELDTKIIGRARKQKLMTHNEYIYEQFIVDNNTYIYQQIESSFTQPNAFICQKMLKWAQSHSCLFGGDLLELYCGNGNFTLPLAKNFNKVLATEISKTSVNSANYNIQKNNIHNIKVVRLSSEEFTQAFNQERKFNRLKNISLNQYNFTTILVDPPRAGLDKGTLDLISRFNNIIYISCNPMTLIDNLHTLTDTHTLKHIAFFDQFPYTHHRECGVILNRKN